LVYIQRVAVAPQDIVVGANEPEDLQRQGEDVQKLEEDDEVLRRDVVC